MRFKIMSASSSSHVLSCTNSEADALAKKGVLWLTMCFDNAIPCVCMVCLLKGYVDWLT